MRVKSSEKMEKHLLVIDSYGKHTKQETGIYLSEKNVIVIGLPSIFTYITTFGRVFI